MTVENMVVTVGLEFPVQLKSTPTTGYLWDVSTLPDGVEFLNSDYERPARDLRPGDPVFQVFRFRALRAGEHTITFVLKRRWESGSVESHTLTVQAK